MKKLIFVMAVLLNSSFLVGQTPEKSAASTKFVLEEKKLDSKEDIVKKLNEQIEKKDKMNLLQSYDLLEAASKHLAVSFDQEFLVKVLAFYPSFFKVDENHYHLEMFLDIYQSNKTEFDKAIDKALGKDDATEFRARMNICITEAREGNG